MEANLLDTILYGLGALSFWWIGYSVFQAGKSAGIVDGRQDGIEVGRALGYVDGWFDRHRGNPIPAHIVRYRRPTWYLNQMIIPPPCFDDGGWDDDPRYSTWEEAFEANQAEIMTHANEQLETSKVNGKRVE